MTITTYANIDLSKVTQEQLDRCHRIINENTGEVFYQVESESDPTVEYEVHYSKEHHHFTCTCKSGQNGFANCKKSRYCKHVTWSLKAAADYKQEIAEQSQIERYVRQGVDRETSCRVVYAKAAMPTELEIKRAQQANKARAFSLLK